MGYHTNMKLTHNGDERLRATELGHDLPQPLPADSVEGLGQVHKGGVEVLMLLHTLFLEEHESVAGLPHFHAPLKKECLIEG